MKWNPYNKHNAKIKLNFNIWMMKINEQNCSHVCFRTKEHFFAICQLNTFMFAD